jgi:diadenosine tetraphosphate (Ap4A) HIT family hydrolase
VPSAAASDPAACLICDRIALAARGDNPMLIAEMRSGYAVLGDNQFLRGYSLLLAREHVRDLHELRGAAREAFLRDMVILGEAVSRVTKAVKMNYAMLGNTDPHLHCHVHARYGDEPDPYRRGPITGYPSEMRDAPRHRFSAARDRSLIAAIRDELRVLDGTAAEGR